MKRILKTYNRQIVILVLVLAGFVLLWNNIFPQWKAANWWPFYLAFFILVTVIVHYLLFNSLKRKPGRFIAMFMITTLGKLVLFITALILNVIYSPFHPASIIAPFLFFYLIFTFFEVRQLSVISRGKHSAGKENSSSEEN